MVLKFFGLKSLIKKIYIIYIDDLCALREIQSLWYLLNKQDKKNKLGAFWSMAEISVLLL